jgi:hypothetical protein
MSDDSGIHSRRYSIIRHKDGSVGWIENWQHYCTCEVERPATLEEAVLMDKVVWGTDSLDDRKQLLELINRR